MPVRTLVLFLSIAALVVRPAAAALRDAPDPSLLSRRWEANWIAAPHGPKNEFGVWLFRKQLRVAGKPARFVVHVTADCRYRFFVNGHSVCFGPQRSDTWVWRYETVDLAPWLRAGDNVLAARVWSYGELSPYATVGTRTGFLLQGDGGAERVADTDQTWKVTADAAYSPLPVKLPTYIVVGPGFRIDGASYSWGWNETGFDDSHWQAARNLGHGMPVGWGTDMDHPLVPRSIPLMEETPIRFAAVRRTSGVTVPEGFLTGSAPLTVAARTHATVLFDQEVETSAFPQLVLSGGKGSRVRLTYAEALVDSAGAKGNRNEVEGRKMAGIFDEFVADGAPDRHFSPPNYRTYRYVEADIESGAEPLTIEELSGTFTGYPFVERATFAASDPVLQKIWDVGWRTARLCAFETYMDCPYYERLQYVGDTRIQALISLYVSGDDRLMRNAIELYDRSRLAEGLTQSRYPSVAPQVINTFSLFWVEMVHDYWMHRPDADFVRARLPGVEAVLGWFERKMDAKTGLLGPLPYWTFVDWTEQWPWDDARGIGGEPGGARSGGSSIVSLQFALTLRAAAALCRSFGRVEMADRYERLADKICAAVTDACWDEKRALFADAPAKTMYSQHANALAVLAGAIDGVRATELMRRVVADRSLVQCSTYFRFYLLRASKRAGLGDDYLAQLGPWRTMLDLGLTTFAEKPDPTRSDCHAWSASPVYELLATVAGIEPASPGFTTVRIEPHLGALSQAEATLPHPRGIIKVSYRRRGTGMHAVISLPKDVSGTFRWKGKDAPLKPGEQTLELE